MENAANRLRLTGALASAPKFSHEVYGERFWQFELSVPRLSGAVDLLPVTVSERLLGGEVSAGTGLRLEGQVRSYNKVIDGANRLLITAFAQEVMGITGEENPNVVALCGVICKAPVRRVTPLGREIADMVLAVERGYGRSDYLPCVVWGRNARFVSGMAVGERVKVEGRLQSRGYLKVMADGTTLEKVAYEVSVGRVERVGVEEGAK